VLVDLKLTFQSPRSLYEEASRELRAVDQAALFNDSRHQKKTEKWCAGVFGIGYERFVDPCQVAANDTDQRLDADFFVQKERRNFAFQLVEAQDPARRRGDEYRTLAFGTVQSIRYEPERGGFEGPNWIASQIAKKAAKNYAQATDLNLLVYANFSARQLQHAALVDATVCYRKSFASIWVITDLHIGALHSTNVLGRIDGWGIIFDVSEK